MYVPYANPELWPPAPHVKDIPGGHPHLPQIKVLIIVVKEIKNKVSLIGKIINSSKW